MRSDSKNRFTVSSAAPPPSAEALENAPDLASPCASKENGCFKENININKSGASNLSLEPQQMKKKKKGGKLNLRKSLAWDRAFFTEEGVLDPLELSAISGVSCRGGLPFISEDSPVSSSQDENFLKDKEYNHSSSKLDLSSSNHMTSTYLASYKVPTNAGSKLGSKCSDCPRPLPSPSLKRWENANVGKTTSQELKLPKVPGLKSGLSPTCATTRSTLLRGSHVKHKQITQPDFSIQSDAELKSSSKSRKNTEIASRANTPQSAHRSDGNLVRTSLLYLGTGGAESIPGCSSFNRRLSINMSPMTVDKAYNSGPKTIPMNVTKIRPDNSCESKQYDSATFAASYSQNAHISGRILHPSQNQTLKPSGLRMPSPSLSFFSQPKPSAFRDLPLRDTDSYYVGSRNPGSLRLLEKLSRPSKSFDKIPDSRTSSSKVICSRTDSAASSHVSVTDLVKSNLEQNPMYEIQGPHMKKITVRVSHENAELQKIDTQVPAKNGSCEQATDNFLENAIDDCPVKSACGSEWRYAELGSKQSCAILESPKLSAIDERHEIENKCNFLVLDHDSTHCIDGFNNRVQNTPVMHSDWRKTRKRDCREAHVEETDPLKYSLGENDIISHKNISNEKGRASEQRDVSQQNRYNSESMKVLERGEAMAESPYCESKQLNAIEVLTDNLPAAEPRMQNSVIASTVDNCKNDTNLMSEVGNDINQPGESPEVLKQLPLQNSKQEENVDELLLLVSDRNGEKVIDTKNPLRLSLGKRHKSNPGKETAITQPPTMVECDSVANPFSSEICNSPISSIFDCDAGITYGNLSDCLHQDTQSIDINDSPLPESMMSQLSREDTLKKTEEVPHLQVSSEDNELTSTMSLKNSASEIQNLKGLKDTQTLLVHSSESNMLNNCCFQQSECIAGDEIFVQNLVRNDDCMQAKHLPDVCSAVNAVGGVEDSVTSQNEVLKSISRSSTPAKESPLKHETCNNEYETGSGITDSTTDPSRAELSYNSIKVEVSEDTNDSPSCLCPKLDHDKVETTLLPNNKHGDGDLEAKKSLLLVIPPNAIPFSDEWLAAMEAAGEDILTRKSGAVQNSPPDKPLPEPSPWSPVKKKNNQITPFDCTKFIAPSDS